MNQSCHLVNCFKLMKVVSKSLRRDSSSVVELVLRRRPFALVEVQSYCLPFIFITITIEALVDCQRDQECRFTQAMAEELLPVLEARSCLSPEDLKLFEFQELAGSFVAHQ